MSARDHRQEAERLLLEHARASGEGDHVERRRIAETALIHAALGQPGTDIGASIMLGEILAFVAFLIWLWVRS